MGIKFLKGYFKRYPLYLYNKLKEMKEKDKDQNPTENAPVENNEAQMNGPVEIIKQEPVEMVYSLMSGMDESEYYSFECPIIENGNIVLKNPFKKGQIVQQVLDERLEEYFYSQISLDTLEFELSMGIFTKSYPKNSIYWLNMDEKEANNKIKDLVIQRYNMIVPSLITRMNTLDEQLRYKNEDNNLMAL